MTDAVVDLLRSLRADFDQRIDQIIREAERKPDRAECDPPPSRISIQKKRLMARAEILRRDEMIADWKQYRRREDDHKDPWTPMPGCPRPWTISAFCAETGVDRSDFGRWQRGDLPRHSKTSKRIERALIVPPREETTPFPNSPVSIPPDSMR
jgi:hypothetical protein